MALAAGSRLGPYEILAPLGTGGMGEVYRARDTKVGREVALKVLPDSLGHDPERLSRFEHEAHVLGALNHPHIAHIYGVEDSTGVPALVIELVEGPTLADRIAQGPFSIDEALPIAKQIAEALEAAHEQGIIHRDLKPANIKVRADGTVKVLDFGLAKAFDPSASGAGRTMSPTLSVHATHAGTILGTAGYMAPEQARGKAVDRRADIWAFGCVLYEMLTGRRAFEGDDISTTLAAVLNTDPDWQLLPPTTPRGLRQLLVRCLKKDPRDRLQAIGDARTEIGDLLSGVAEVPAGTSIAPAGSSLWRWATAVGVALLLTALGTGAIGWFVARSTVAKPRASRLLITAPTTGFSLGGLSHDIAITPDGSRVVYIGANGTALFVRPLDQLEATQLVQGGAPRDPFVSPDGQWVGFFDGTTALKKVAITGGPAALLARIHSSERGATWVSDGTIIFATAGPPSGLQRVSADGGEPTILTLPDPTHGEANHWWPESVPGGQAVLYTVTASSGGFDAASVAALDLRSGRSTILLRGGSHAQYASSGHLVYAAAGMLRAVGFDPTRLSVVGPARPVVPQVLTTPRGVVEAALAGDGTLVYATGGAANGLASTLVWVDRQGRETPTGAPPRAYGFPRISPDGTRVAVNVMQENADVWLWDLARANLTRVTSDQAGDYAPVWTPDGRRLVFTSGRPGILNLYSQAPDGIGDVERLTESPNLQLAPAITPDGRWAVFTERSPRTRDDVMAVRLDDTRKVLTLLQTPFDERNGVVSPDGRWLAYESNDTGAFEIYVRPFPDANSGHSQISTSGGIQPLWARSGEELFYFAPDGALMRVAVAGGPAWSAGAPTKMLEGSYVLSLDNSISRNYDIAGDGQRFLMLKAAGSDATSVPQIVVVQHFDEELKRLVPLK
jgi:serine/threonine-protein kinase